ncbi:MAG TPA: hypothetical protein VE078_18115 [Thermoanaerobaculia bacterium]|nr:hypothetical protein [Thermoanaerobaculia bacterium]
MSKVVRRHSRLLLVVLFLVALAVVPAVTIASHSWGGYHWARTSNPFTLKVGDNVNSTWDPYLNEAISDWTASSVLNLTKVVGSSNNNCRPTAGRIEVCNRTYGNNGWLGIAQIWITGSVHITQATTKVNDTYFNTAQYNTPAWRRLVMCQEIAHDFGLDHQDENFNNGNLGSCMDYTSDPDGPPTNEHPNSHDFAQIESIYSHLDSTTTVGAAMASTVPPAMRQLVLDGVDQWGPIVKAVKNGRGLATTHVADFGRGNKVVTHVLWTLDHKRHH